MTEEVHFVVAKKQVSIRFDVTNYNQLLPYVQGLNEPFEIFKITTENVTNQPPFKKEEQKT